MSTLSELRASQQHPASRQIKATVANQTARFALTTAAVQTGDFVFQTDTGVLYQVTDDSSLSSSAGYTPIANIPWANVLKTGSSLADLATRSASDLSSGTLPDARFPAALPAISGAALTGISGGLSFQDVANNTAKLALSGLTSWKNGVRITGEGNRLEIYIGGTISSNSSWLVLKNTINLDVFAYAGLDPDTVSINGVNLVSGSPVNCGWVDPLAFTIASTGDAAELGMVDPGDASITINSCTALKWSIGGGFPALRWNNIGVAPTHSIPMPFPPRASVELQFDYYYSDSFL